MRYLLLGYVLMAQSLFAQTDSLSILRFEDFMARVKAHHPLAKQADLQLSRGEAALLSARGAFDPKAFADVAQKQFDEQRYYSLINGGVKIPTWYGLALTGGYEQNDGAFLNPQSKVPAAGLWYAGVSLSIGQGLFIDKRRAELKKAELYQESTLAGRQLLLNELLFEAGKTYWEWFEAYHILEVYEDALELAVQRFEATREGAALGDRPAIDTLEAGIQVQNRRLSLMQARLEYANMSALLSIYLWVDGLIPLEIAEGTLPPAADQLADLQGEEVYANQMDTLLSLHPQVQQYNFKLEQLDIERRWKKEQLKPVLNLKYNAINEPVNGNPLADYSINNYTWGLEFSMPVFLRKERGALRMADIQIEETRYDLSNKREALAFKARASLNEWATTKEQISLYTQTVEDYRGLLQGERDLFNAGESSLFMVNSRELGFINAQVKRITLLSKNRKARLATDYALGLLAQ